MGWVAYFKHHNIKTVSFRIANPYGPRSQMKHHKYSMVNWFIRQAMEDKEITVFGDGKQARDYIYVEDLAEAFIAAALSDKTNGQCYNVGSGVSTEFIEMAESVVNVVGSGKLKKIPWPENYENVETGDYVSNIEKIKKDTGWAPKIFLSDGLRKTYKYYLEKREKYW